jgi:hypothetical protein
VLTLYQVSELLGLSRIEAEDFLAHHQVPLAALDEAALDREASLFEATTRRNVGRQAIPVSAAASSI